MDRIRIRGGRKLSGEIPISGAKNAALKLMAASLLTAEPLTLTNVPRLADVRAMAELLTSFGHTDIIDLGDLTAARGCEMALPIWLRLMGALNTPYFNLKVVR